jgi:translation initiation factor 2D
MTPGLTGWDPEIQSGDVVQVLLKNKAPVAVGVAAFDIGRLSKAVGEKGKAIYLVHCYQDELWGLGSKSHPPEPSTDLESDAMPEKALQELSLDMEKGSKDRQYPQGTNDTQTDVAKQSTEAVVDAEPLEDTGPSVSGKILIFIPLMDQKLTTPSKLPLSMGYMLSKLMINKVASHFLFHRPR